MLLIIRLLNSFIYAHISEGVQMQHKERRKIIESGDGAPPSLYPYKNPERIPVLVRCQSRDVMIQLPPAPL